MLDTLMTFLQGSVEYEEFQKYGLLNLNTICAVGILVLTVFEAAAASMQGWTIWKRRSGDAVSVTLFNYNGSAFVACGIYGYYINAATAAFNGVVIGFIHLIVIAPLLRYKRPLKWWEILIAALCPFMIPAMILAKESALHPYVFGFVTLGIGIAVATQPVEMWLKKKTGAVDIRMYLVYMPTTLVWLAYAITVDDTALIFGNCVGVVVVTAIILVWGHYRLREPNPPPQLLRVLKFFGREALSRK